ncbi:MAG: hypothetical protein QF824_04065 [Candidatus Woesearchaeota archaeon]|jgi:hypothetical protein|nr:hypothetical protein [Candidatus Woesearchaeota archaeon]
MKKRGQGSSEYLIILGVIILIAGIIPFSMKGQSGEWASSSFWGLADISVTSYSLSAGTDEFKANIGNNIGHSISSLAVTIGDAPFDCEETTLSAGQKTSCTGRLSCESKGEKYSFDVDIEYSDDDTGNVRDYTGERYRLEGKCVK